MYIYRVSQKSGNGWLISKRLLLWQWVLGYVFRIKKIIFWGDQNFGGQPPGGPNPPNFFFSNSNPQLVVHHSKGHKKRKILAKTASRYLSPFQNGGTKMVENGYLPSLLTDCHETWFLGIFRIEGHDSVVNYWKTDVCPLWWTQNGGHSIFLKFFFEEQLLSCDTSLERA